MKNILVFMIHVYRAVAAPFFGPCCRFQPSCSTYAEDAIRQKGAVAGVKLALRRLFKCHPFHPGGFDPVEK